MAKPCRLSPLAEVDLEDIWVYTARHWSKAQADSYHNSFVAAFEELWHQAQNGHPVDVLPGFQKLPCGSHVIYFLEHADHTAVIRILHQRQDAERHLHTP